MPTLGESGSEVSHLILKHRNFAEVTRLTEDINKAWLKSYLKDIKNIINSHTFIMDETDKGEPVTPRMHVYKTKT